MKQALLLFSVLCAAAPPVSCAAASPVAQVSVEKSWTAGQLFGVCRSSGLIVDGERITLENRLLVEDDGPACGYSSNPSAAEVLSDGVLLRKTLMVERLPARAAWVTALLYPDFPPEPNNGRHVVFSVNGHEIPSEVRHFWTQARVEPGFLREGKNEILLRVQEPDTRFKTWVALDENFAVGSDTRLRSPNRSARSADGGRTFDDARLGIDGKVDGEYPIRLALEAYRAGGWLESPVIDLAEDTSMGPFLLPAEITSVDVRLHQDIPAGTGMSLEVRTSAEFSVLSEAWSPWTTIVGPLASEQIRGRFLQFRVKASSSRADMTPALSGASVRSTYRSPGSSPAIELPVTSTRYPVLRSSFTFEHEDPLFPRLQEFRKTMKLDSVVRDARSEIEMMARIKSWVAGQWTWHLLRPEQDIIEWDAPRIMTPGRDGSIEGGFCLHYAIVLMQALQSFGIPARIVSVDYSLWGGHEVVEAWSTQFGKWIFLDANFDTYFTDRGSGLPLNVLEMHSMFVREYFPGEKIDRDSWSRESLAARAKVLGDSLPVAVVVGGHADGGRLKTYEWWNPPVELSPYCGGYGPLVMGFLRYMPRSNYLSKPRPIPVNHGRTHWGWTGYVNWYDRQTPRAPEHGVFTSRPADLYWNLYQIDFRVSEAGPGRLRFQMETNAPHLREFDVSVNGATMTTKEPLIEAALVAGPNTIEMRTVDVMGRRGTPSMFQCTYTPKGGR